jgi:phosphoserine phosphatase RsbU/P
MSTVLLSTPPDSTGDELRKLIAAAGFVVADHLLGSAPAVDFAPVAVAVMEVRDRVEPATAQTRRWRAELGDQFVPVLWVAPAELVAAGLDAGADVVLTRPVEPALFTAQLRALARAQATTARVAARANESRLLGDRLRKVLAQLEGEQELARRVRAMFLPQALPEVGSARFRVCYRPRARTGGDFHDVRRLDENHVGFLVGDVVGTGASTGGLLGVFVQLCAELADATRPAELLTAVNRQLLSLGADDLPLVALLAGVLNTTTGAVTLARAGLPPAVHLPVIGEAGAWTVPGPFLGTGEVTYEPLTRVLNPGDRLLIGTDGTRADGDPGGSEHLLDAATKHRATTGPAFVDAVARELLTHVRHADDFTLLSVELER